MKWLRFIVLVLFVSSACTEETDPFGRILDSHGNAGCILKNSYLLGENDTITYTFESRLLKRIRQSPGNLTKHYTYNTDNLILSIDYRDSTDATVIMESFSYNNEGGLISNTITYSASTGSTPLVNQINYIQNEEGQITQEEHYYTNSSGDTILIERYIFQYEGENMVREERHSGSAISSLSLDQIKVFEHNSTLNPYYKFWRLRQAASINNVYRETLISGEDTTLRQMRYVVDNRNLPVQITTTQGSDTLRVLYLEYTCGD